MRISTPLCLAALLLTAGCDVQLTLETDPETEPEPEPEPQPEPEPRTDAAFCKTASLGASGSDVVAITYSQEVLRLVRWDGTSVELGLSSEPAPSGANQAVQVIAGGGLVVASEWWSTFEPSDSWSRVRWFAPSGELLDEWTTESSLGPQAIGADGTTILNEWVPDAPTSRQLVRLPTGERVDLGWGWVMGAPFDDGTLAMELYDAPDRFALVDPRTGAERAVEPPAGSYPARTHRGFAYLTSAGDDVALVHETLAGTETFELPALADGASIYIAAASETTGDLLLVDTSAESAHLDLETGQLTSLDISPPGGLWALEDTCGLTGPSMGRTGEIATPLRDDAVVQLFQLDPASGSLTSLGLPFAAPGFLSLGSRGGTTVAASGSAGDTFCPLPTFEAEAPPGALPIGTVQIARAGGAAYAFETVSAWDVPWSYPISADGGCVAVPDGEGGHQLLDVSTGEVSIAPSAGTWLFSR
ncbi:MAG: hypothetical protein IPM79_13050 [Polyangiaceae bacterium]|jgi:hypothetical protein|nr:hypothetical protein [Polyangiaceae bacterium]MBK8938530.1 hypothetical protein [Polyangiaceae bacterium]